MKRIKNLLPICIIILIYNCVLFPNILPAQTYITGGEISGAWTIEASPYYLSGAVTVPDQQTLTIEPGVEVIFTEHKKFIVRGQLLAIGTRDSMITFKSQSISTGWHGLRFQGIPITNDTSKLIYCTIENGIANGPSITDRSGGGILVNLVDKLVIDHCRIFSNKVQGEDSKGGGIGIINSSPIITNNSISDNEALDGYGGGIGVNGGSPLIKNNNISVNRALDGAGVGVTTGTPLITSNRIKVNEAPNGHGGGIVLSNSNAVLTNNLILRNLAYGGGGIGIFQSQNPVLINNTITDNEAEHGGGMDLPLASAICINSIIYGNSATHVGDEVHMGFNYSASFYHCNIKNGLEGFAQDHSEGCPDYNGTYENNIESAPEFVGFHQNFHLTQLSPCIEAGIDSIQVDGTWYRAPATDFFGRLRPRPAGTTPDIGAIEFLDGGWEYKEPLPVARRYCTGTVLDNKIYVLGGSFFVTTGKRMGVYDPISDTWDDSKADIPFPLDGATSGAVNGKVYLIGGRDSNGALNSVFEYDPVLDEWSTKTPMPTSRFFPSTAVIDGKIYVMGGISFWSFPAVFESTVEMYDPQSDSWTTLADMNMERAEFAAEVVDGKIYVMGGRQNTNFGPYNFRSLSTVEMYNPAQDSWILIGEMPDRRSYHGSGVIDDLIYVFGGTGSNSGHFPTWQFDPSSNTWTELDADYQNFAKNFASAVAMDANNSLCLYGLGGATYDNLPTDAVLKYCPQDVSTNTIEVASKLMVLHQNYPNPFSTKTSIQYDLASPGRVIMTIFNLNGQEVAKLFDGFQPEGQHEIEWQAHGIPGGVYLYRLKTQTGTYTGKCILQD